MRGLFLRDCAVSLVGVAVCWPALKVTSTVLWGSSWASSGFAFSVSESVSLY